MSLKHFIKKVLQSSEVATIKFSIKPFWYSADQDANMYFLPPPLIRWLNPFVPQTITYISPLISIDKDRFQEVAHAVNEKRILTKKNKKTVEKYLGKDPDVAGGYVSSQDLFVFRKETRKDLIGFSASIVHEATHAICDMSSFGEVHLPLAEAAAYLAETFYSREATPADLSTLREEDDPLRFHANLLIESVGKPYAFSVLDCVPLMRAVLRTPAYAGKRFGGAYQFDGLNKHIK